MNNVSPRLEGTGGIHQGDPLRLFGYGLKRRTGVMTLHRTEERGAGHADPKQYGDQHAEQRGGLLGDEVYASDPVCGMDVAVSDAQFKAEVAGEVFYFCSRSCKSRFERHPEKYT